MPLSSIVFFLIAKVGKRGSMEEKSRDSLKSIFRTPNKCTYLISAFLLNLEGSYSRNKRRKREKRSKNHFFGAVIG